MNVFFFFGSSLFIFSFSLLSLISFPSSSLEPNPTFNHPNQGLTREQESDLVHSVLTDCLDEPLSSENWEVDEFAYLYTAAARPSIANDTITLPLRHAADHVIKLSISHALAQSTKLMLYEELILELVAATKEIPQQLSATGKVALSRKAIAQLMGR